MFASISVAIQLAVQLFSIVGSLVGQQMLILPSISFRCHFSLHGNLVGAWSVNLLLIRHFPLQASF